MMDFITQEEKLARIRINSFSYLRSDWYSRLLGIYGSACEILKQSAETLAHDGGVSAETAATFLEETSKIDAEQELKKTEEKGGTIWVHEEAGYPELLKDIPEAPMALYVLGKTDFSKPSIAIVGTRLPTAYGRRTASTLADSLSRCGMAVTSGLARGIDTAAHKAVLEAGGTTWAVIGTGIGRCYPPENKALAEKILEKGGAIISELPFDRGPMPFHFPRRNRIISGLSFGTIVVEGKATSGALITAKIALEQNREVMAVPGPVDSEQSAGPNALIKDGAALVTCARDVVDCLPAKYLFGVLTPEESKSDGKRETAMAGITEDERTLLKCMASEELSLNQFIDRLGWSVPKTSGVLFELETKELITFTAGLYSKRV